MYTHSYSVFTYILKTILQSSNHVTLVLNVLFIVQRKSLLSLHACWSLTLALCITDHPLFALCLFLQSKPCFTLDQAARELWKSTMFLLLLCFFSHKPVLFFARCCYLTQLLLVRRSFFVFILRDDCCLWSSRGKKQVRVKLFCSGCQHGASVAQRSPHPTPTPLAISCEVARSPVIPVVPHPFPLLPCCNTGSPPPPPRVFDLQNHSLCHLPRRAARAPAACQCVRSKLGSGQCFTRSGVADLRCDSY